MKNRTNGKDDLPGTALLKLALARTDRLKEQIQRCLVPGRMEMDVKSHIEIAESHAATILEFLKTAQKVE